jgi:replication factor C large subunit
MTCNDAWQSKLSPLRSVSKLVEIKPLPASIIFEILVNISKTENMKADLSILQKISIKSQGDVRAAMNDFQSYTSGGSILEHATERRDREDNIFNILKRLFKERESFIELFDTSRLSLDEILLWIEENIPREYKNEALVNAYHALGKADVFRGRIYRNQSWRFLIYQNIFQSAGISFAKRAPLPGFTKYEPPKRVLKIWQHNQKTAKKKTIAKKYASFVHCSTRRALNDFPLIMKIMQNPSIRKQLKLSEEEMNYLEA